MTCGLDLVAAGEALRDEKAVARAVAALPGRQPVPDGVTWGGRAALHDALHASALWSLTGLEPRDTRRAALAGVPMKEHFSVAALHTVVPIAEPARSTSARAWRAIALLVALLTMAFAFVGAGQSLLSGRGDAPARDLLAYALPALEANVAFQRWQLLGPWNAGRCLYEWGGTTIDLCAARHALTWDFVLIAAYTYVGARVVSWAYGRCIGQRRVGDPPSRLWSVLGTALPLAVVADLAENSMTFLTTSMLRSGMDTLPLATGFVMALASLVKVAGMAGVLVLGLVAMSRQRAKAVRHGGLPAAMSRVAPAIGFVPDPKVPEGLHGLDASLEGQRSVRGGDGFDGPAWADKRDDHES